MLHATATQGLAYYSMSSGNVAHAVILPETLQISIQQVCEQV